VLTTADISAAADGPTEFPTYGVAFTPPPGWINAMRRGAKQVGRWAKVDSEGKSEAIVSVEVLPVKGKTAREIADRWAAGLGGATKTETMQIAGEEGVRLSVRHAGGDLKPVAGTFVKHGDVLYIIAGGATDPKIDVIGPMDAVQKSLKWIDPAEPTALLDETIDLSIKGSGLRIEVPAVAAEVDPPKDAPGIALAFWSPAAMSDDMMCIVQVLQPQDKLTFSNRIDKFRDQMNERGLYASPLAWKFRDDKGLIAVSNVVDVKSAKPGAPRMVWVIRELSDGQIVLCNATLFTKDEKKIEAYTAQVRKMVASASTRGKKTALPASGGG
jgi:hypothetical protein